MLKTTKRSIFIALKNDKISSIGIGSMIVFIAMVLVAGIAASVLIQTSNTLEAQALYTGRETRTEVSSDIDVLKITGQYGIRDVGGGTYVTGYHNMTIMVTPRGASEINLDEVIIQISNGSKLTVLSYESQFASSPSANGVFNTANVFDLNSTGFGIIVVEDGDNSCTSGNPGINHGDKALLTINISACFDGFIAHEDIEGLVIPEHGSPGVFLFRTPGVTTRTINGFL